MQTDLLGRKKWDTIAELRASMSGYIENLHNEKRRPPALDMLTPTYYEQLHAPTLKLT